MANHIVHIAWQLVGKVMVVDEGGNALVLGKDQDGNDAREGIIAVNVKRFDSHALETAEEDAVKACGELLAKFDPPPTT